MRICTISNNVTMEEAMFFCMIGQPDTSHFTLSFHNHTRADEPVIRPHLQYSSLALNMHFKVNTVFFHRPCITGTSM
ncbi:hypothetical protein X975_20825, partial [Stegodyphus mimosarum]